MRRPGWLQPLGRVATPLEIAEMHLRHKQDEAYLLQRKVDILERNARVAETTIHALRAELETRPPAAAFRRSSRTWVDVKAEVYGSRPKVDPDEGKGTE